MSCDKSAKEDVLECTCKDAAPSELWYGFPNETTCTPLALFPDADGCHKLVEDLNTTYKLALSSTTKKNQQDKVLENVNASLSQIYGQAVTKQHLEHAFHIVKTSPASSSTAPLQTSTTLPEPQSIETVETKLDRMTVSASAQQPQQDTSASSIDTSDPTISTTAVSSSNPNSTAVDDLPAAKTVSLAGVKQAVRPTSSKDGHVYTNHFTIDLKQNTKLYEYQIVGLRNTKADLSRSKKRVVIARKIEASEILRINRDAFACNDHGRIIAWRQLKENVQENEIIDTTPVDDYSREFPGEVAGQLNLDVVFKRVINLDGLLSYAQRKNPGYGDTGAASALDILISSGARTENVTTGQPAVIRIDDNRFFTLDDEERLDDSHGLIAIRGYSSCVQPVDGGLRLNVNTGLSAFYKQQKVINVIETFKNNPSAFPHGKGAQHLIGVRVKILYDRCKPDEVNKDMDTLKRRTKTITGFSSRPASQTMFDRNGTKTSVWQHFDETYPYVRPRPRKDQICVNTSSTEMGKECWFMPDQLEIVPGQLYRKTLDKVNAELPAAMIELACKKPRENKSKILDNGLPALGLIPSSPNSNIIQPQLQVLRDAGMNISSTMLKVPFKKMPFPTIQYGGSNPEPVQISEHAAWKTRGQEFLTHSKRVGPNDLVQFLHLEGASLAFATTYVQAFLDSFQENLGTQQHIVRSNIQPISIREDLLGLSPLEASLKALKAKLTVLILPDDNKDLRKLYANFRIVNDQYLGSASIVLKEKRMLNIGAQNGPEKLKGYMASNAMKLNVRFGNENHSVKNGFKELMKGPLCNTLVLGADLIHPSQSSAQGTPSIAALVGSVSATFGKLLGSARYQPKGSEIIYPENMKDMVAERIRAWQNNNGLTKGLPPRILYFRDGTGLTQYSGILEEIRAIKTAWTDLFKNLQPKPLLSKPLEVTAIVAVKRHNTRFYPIDASKESQTTTGNCKPGIIVDTQVTSPLYMDFFLQSHDVEKGSAKPTHYFVLSNDMKLKGNDIHQLTNNFCYTFAHSTSAVSYPSPVYCADKLCERAMLYLHHVYENLPSVSDMSKDQIEREVEIAWQRGRGRGPTQANPWHPNLDDKMFWM
jgi:eukaryotic translation initiation factor 2C